MDFTRLGFRLRIPHYQAFKCNNNCAIKINITRMTHAYIDI
jgi:hypothetical protein